MILINNYTYPSTGPIKNPNDVFPNGNAASFDDVDAYTDWADLLVGGVGSSVFVSGRGYVIEITSDTSNSSQGSYIDISIEVGQTYDVTYDYRVTNYVSSTQVTRAWTGFTTAPLFEFEIDGVWRTHTEPGLVASSTTSLLRFYSTRIGAAGANTIQIDNITAIKQ